MNEMNETNAGLLLLLLLPLVFYSRPTSDSASAVQYGTLIFRRHTYQAMVVRFQGDVTGSFAGRILGRSLPNVHSCPLRSFVT